PYVPCLLTAHRPGLLTAHRPATHPAAGDSAAEMNPCAMRSPGELATTAGEPAAGRCRRGGGGGFSVGAGREPGGEGDRDGAGRGGGGRGWGGGGARGGPGGGGRGGGGEREAAERRARAGAQLLVPARGAVACEVLEKRYDPGGRKCPRRYRGPEPEEDLIQ